MSWLDTAEQTLNQREIDAKLLEALKVCIERGFSLGYMCEDELELYKRITGRGYEEQS